MKMTAKRYAVSVIFLLLLALFIGIASGCFIDPYNVFHVNNIRDIGIEPNKHYIKMVYILENPDKFDTFLFGSSKVGAIHTEKIKGEKCYNMTYSRGVPSEHLANIRTFLANGVHVKKLYIGVDSSSYTVNPNEHISQQLRCPYEYLRDHPLHFYYLYMNPSMVLSSLRHIYHEYRNYDYVSTFYQYGAYSPYGKNSTIDWDRAAPSVGKENLLKETLKDMQSIADICRKENISLTVFVNPMHHTTYNASLSIGHQDFLKGLANISEFYNFGGLNDIALNNDNFYDTSHYKPEIGDMILEVICNNRKYNNLYEQGFGWKVNKNNVDMFLSLPEISGANI